MSELALAVDIGGTKMAAGIVDRSGTVLHRSQVATPPTHADWGGPGGGPGGGEGIGQGAEAEMLWRTLADLVAGVLTAYDRKDVAVCGVGCGGPMSPGGETVSPLNIAGWRSFPLRGRLHELTGLAVFVDNDAKALARGEGWTGAAAGHRDYLAMVVSTGVGGGLVVDGRLLDGRLGNAGHIGHVVVVPDGRRCVCGGQGCLEAEASGTSVAAITGKPAAQATPDVVERTGMLVGRAVASVANLLDLPLAVVSGSVAFGYGEPFFASAQKEVVLRCGLEFSRDTTVVPGALGELGPLTGAAAVGWYGLDGQS